jgi:hypothetical protein
MSQGSTISIDLIMLGGMGESQSRRMDLHGGRSEHRGHGSRQSSNVPAMRVVAGAPD